MSINQKLMDLGLVRTLEEIVIEDNISDTDTENEPGRYLSLSEHRERNWSLITSLSYNL